MKKKEIRTRKPLHIVNVKRWWALYLRHESLTIGADWNKSRIYRYGLLGHWVIGISRIHHMLQLQGSVWQKVESDRNLVEYSQDPNDFDAQKLLCASVVAEW